MNADVIAQAKLLTVRYMRDDLADHAGLAPNGEPTLRCSPMLNRISRQLAPFVRCVDGPLVDYVLQVERENRDRTIAVAISVMVERHWYHYFLHNQRAEVLTAMLLLGGDRRINIIDMPWYLEA